MGGSNNRHLFLTILEVGKAKVEVRKGLISGERSVPGVQKLPGYGVLTEEKEQASTVPRRARIPS